MPTLRASLLLALLGSVTLTGCPKKGPVLDEEQQIDPTANFQAGIESLVPDRKGQVDHAGAYGFFAEAATLAEQAGRPSKKAHFNAGWTAEELGNVDAALTHYQAAFDADPTYQPALYSLTRLLGTEGRDDEVVAAFERYLEAAPDDRKARSDYMQALVDAEQYDAAIEEGRAILRQDPKNDAVYRALSGLYLAQGQIPMARLMGDKALELNDADPNIYNNMGVVLLEQDDVPGAIEKFQKARQLLSTHFEANMNLGAVALNAGDYALALECYDAALQTRGTDYDAQLGRAVALRGNGDFDGAGAVYDGLIEAHPERDEAYFNASTLHEAYTKDFAKAKGYLEAYKDARAGQLGPNDAVFKRITDIDGLIAAEAERKRLEEEARKAAEERERRAKELLAKMEATVMDAQGRLDANAGCLPEEVSMEVGGALEMAMDVISTEDTSMATDVGSFLDDYYLPMLDTAIADNCAAAAPEGAGDDEAMEGEDAAEGDTAEGDDTAEAEEAPAEDAATEEAPADDAATEEAPADDAATEEAAAE